MVGFQPPMINDAARLRIHLDPVLGFTLGRDRSWVRLVRQAPRVFQDSLPINPKRPRYGKGRCAIGQALGDF
jgi:hypothetical protein